MSAGGSVDPLSIADDEIDIIGPSGDGTIVRQNLDRTQPWSALLALGRVVFEDVFKDGGDVWVALSVALQPCGDGDAVKDLSGSKILIKLVHVAPIQEPACNAAGVWTLGDEAFLSVCGRQPVGCSFVHGGVFAGRLARRLSLPSQICLKAVRLGRPGLRERWAWV
mgnify:CR=1 FL=1